MSKYQIEARIRELEGRIEELKLVRDSFEPKPTKMGRPVGSLKYTPEQLDYLSELAKKRNDGKLKDKEVVPLFNKKFGTNFTPDSRLLYNIMQRQGYITPEYHPRDYIESEDKFIIENEGKLVMNEIAKRLGRTRDSVKNRAVWLRGRKSDTILKNNEN